MTKLIGHKFLFLFTEGVADHYTIHNEPAFSLDKRWIFTSKETLAFKVTACQDAHLVVATVPFYKDTDAAEIIFGTNNNRETKIIADRQNSNDFQVVSTPNILDCDSSREFWISWDGGMLRAGRGPVYSDELVSMAYNLVNVSAVSLTTANGKAGIWTLHRREGDFL